MQGVNTLINTQDCALVEKNQCGVRDLKHISTGQIHPVMERVHARILMKANYGRKKLKQALKNSTIVWLSQEKVIYLYRKFKGGCRKPHQRVGKKNKKI